MSKESYIGGDSIEIIGGSYTEYVGKATYSSLQKLLVTAVNGKFFGDNPEDPPAANLVKYYVKVRIKDTANYNGTFGFDWIDINPVTEEIEKIQDLSISNVEYFYKKGANFNDLGDIVAKSADESGAKKVIAENYRLSETPKPCTNGKVDMPFVLIKPGQKISLSLEVNIPTKETLTDELIYLEGDEFYSFEIVGGNKKDNRTEKKISTEKETLELKIECLKEGPEKTYKILQDSSTIKTLQVGGFTMMENKTLKLKFRVIALVSSDGAPTTKAQALFQKFKDNDIKKYLNENSLNQAGYEVEIENQIMFDNLATADLDDYFYAFDKTAWTTKKYFANITKQKPDVMPGTNTCKAGSWDPVKKECAKIPVSTDTITEDDDIDNVAFGLYQEKLKKKIPTKTYEGGVIILVDFESPTDTSAFSRTSPLNHYKLFVYSTSVGEKEHYAHEIGHMLGLPHLFFDTKEKDSYKIAKENILGNGTTSNEGIIKRISDVNNTSDIYYGYKYLKAIKSHIILKLEKYNTERQIEVNKEIKARDAKKAYFINFKDNDKVGTTQTKKEYFKVWNENIKQIEDYIEDNKKAIIDLKNNKVNNYVESKLQKWFYKTDLVYLLNEEYNYYKKVIEQAHSNYVVFKQGTTKNIMDYHNTRIVYLNNQIRIMRNDIQNYTDIVSEKPTLKPKKK